MRKTAHRLEEREMRITVEQRADKTWSICEDGLVIEKNFALEAEARKHIGQMADDEEESIQDDLSEISDRQTWVSAMRAAT